MASSLRNASKSAQKIHRERSQLDKRRHLGEFEKKKDYRKRAKDYQDKKETLKTLRQKALEKNPDEFYFHMVNSRTKEGVHHEMDKDKDEDSELQQKLMETQDLRYINYKLNIESKKIDKLKSNLHLLDSRQTGIKNKHLIFVDSKKEARKFKPEKHFGTHKSLVDRVHNRPRIQDLEKADLLSTASSSDVKLSNPERVKQYAELAKRVQREKELKIVSKKLENRKHMRESKGQKSKRVLKGTSSRSAVFKWEFERKR